MCRRSRHLPHRSSRYCTMQVTGIAMPEAIMVRVGAIPRIASTYSYCWRGRITEPSYLARGPHLCETTRVYGALESPNALCNCVFRAISTIPHQPGPHLYSPCGLGLDGSAHEDKTWASPRTKTLPRPVTPSLEVIGAHQAHNGFQGCHQRGWCVASAGCVLS